MRVSHAEHHFFRQEDTKSSNPVTAVPLLPVKVEVSELDDHRPVLKANLQFVVPSTAQTRLVSCLDTINSLLLQFHHYYCFTTTFMSLCFSRLWYKTSINQGHYTIPIYLSALQGCHRTYTEVAVSLDVVQN